MSPYFKNVWLAASLLGLVSCATIAPGSANVETPTVANAAVATAGTKEVSFGNASAMATASAASAATVHATPPNASTKSFAEIIKDATEAPGFFTLWRKDDKIWIEVPENMWLQPFFFSINVTHGIGDSSLYGNQMGGFLATGRGGYLVSFKKIGTNRVQLIARNTAFTATNTTPAQRMLERAFSDSLIGATTIVSAPHPERKSVLIDANALLLNDFPSAAGELERFYRQSYTFDAKNSQLNAVKNNETETGFAVQAHYQLGKIVLPSPVPALGSPRPSVPTTIPDVRSLFMGYYYGFSKLPEPMRSRLSDPRVGYFSTIVSDFTDPDRRDIRQRYIHRWRLEKKDDVVPGVLSEPKQSIVFWLDKNIPLAYRDAVATGVLEWNKAFEKIGFKNAVLTKQQQDSDDFDTSATRFASVRWVAGKRVRFGARGPSKVDPRTGEILDADIEMNEEITRIYTGRAKEDPPRPVGATHATALLGGHAGHGELCGYADSKLRETAFALDLLVERGELEYGSPKALQFVLDAVKDIITHEVGHTLGLRHNFRASLAVTPNQLKDAQYGAEHGISSSVMDYNALNIATKDEPQGQYTMLTIGAYDNWAIEYGYQQVAPEDESVALSKTLARATEPTLAYATDEDAGFDPLVEGIDPDVNRSDLSSDPLAFYEKRFNVVHELWGRWQNRKPPVGASYESLRRNFDRGFNLIDQVTALTVKFVGGVSVLRDAAGSGRQPIMPVDVTKQRRALQILTKNLFEVDSFKFKPQFIGSLVPDFDARLDDFDSALNFETSLSVDYSVANRVLDIQRTTLSQLLRDTVASRIVNAREKLADSSKLLDLSELYGTIQKAVWRELYSGVAIVPMRRNLQREHVRMIAEVLTRANPRMPADARSLQREYAVELLAQMRKAVTRSGNSIEMRAHLKESIALLDGALKAQIARTVG